MKICIGCISVIKLETTFAWVRKSCIVCVIICCCHVSLLKFRSMIFNYHHAKSVILRNNSLHLSYIRSLLVSGKVKNKQRVQDQAIPQDRTPSFTSSDWDSYFPSLSITVYNFPSTVSISIKHTYNILHIVNDLTISLIVAVKSVKW